MGDKGGKRSLPKPRKSALKSPSKSEQGANVQFEADHNFSPGYGGKGDTPMTNDLRGKGGKGDKVANGGKSPEKKAPAPVQLRVEKDLPENVTCLTDCEAAKILEGIQEQMVVLSEDPTIKIPISFDKGLQLAKRGGDIYTSPQAVRDILQRLKNLKVLGRGLTRIIFQQDNNKIFLEMNCTDVKREVKEYLKRISELCTLLKSEEVVNKELNKAKTRI